MSAFESFLLAAAKRAPFLVGDAVTSSTEQERAGSAQKAEGTISQQQEEENIAILQRLLVDGPLQPLGLEHALYHILIPAFTASMSAAREVWRAKVALQEVEHNSATNNDAEVPVAAAAAAPDASASGGASTELQNHNLETLKKALADARALLSERQRNLDAAQLKVRSMLVVVKQFLQTHHPPEVSPRV
ncbi:hypothetical protein, conserved [Trypanosoma brucei gambiense DAL972]|uniref:Uncharacterized protein n=1 Tax=Trypanosoma brucei gambiense (strain MHOM/CI/86/DAL972) TaxID=679716 RepID=C9ZY46_TRYB9|nr:hypothetical protein, conserved [Trypanosoma brucei gambiense DAL972]CBH14345.1 hypothetical protein, conserved [Trypanosoma brucei gambiense DAL972]|eukprot:XP_011776611.1 hypothetical protein, conserved [Trypanosoma brucei gambiense DAL972]